MAWLGPDDLASIRNTQLGERHRPTGEKWIETKASYRDSGVVATWPFGSHAREISIAAEHEVATGAGGWPHGQAALETGIPDLDKLDDIDRQLLALLQGNDRLGLAELGKAVGSAPSTVNDRIKRLVRNGVITGFHARVAAEVVGLELLAFILVAWSDPKVEPKFLDKIQKTPNVLECHHVTGAWNYLIKVRAKNTRELETLLASTVKAVAGVQRTDTMIALSSVKEGWVVPV